MLLHGLQSVRQRATGVPDRKINGLEARSVPLWFVPDLRRVEHPGLHPEERHVARSQGPFGQKFHRLRSGEFIQEMTGARPGPKERVDLKGHHRPRVQPQSPGVLGEVGEQVLGVEETHHGDPGGDVHRVHVVAVDERIERRHVLRGYWFLRRRGPR